MDGKGHRRAIQRSIKEVIMIRQIVVFLAIMSAVLFSSAVIAIAEAHDMDKNQALSVIQKSIIPIAAFTANGDMKKLKTALNDGLDAGLTVNEIKEVLVQMYAYCGFPRSLNSINTFMDVLEERKQNGIKDKLGKEPNPIPANKSSIEL